MCRYFIFDIINSSYTRITRLDLHQQMRGVVRLEWSMVATAVQPATALPRAATRCRRFVVVSFPWNLSDYYQTVRNTITNLEFSSLEHFAVIEKSWITRFVTTFLKAFTGIAFKFIPFSYFHKKYLNSYQVWL